MKVYVNEGRTLFVRIYEGDGDGSALDGAIVEVATRREPDDVWGPPVRVVEERP